MVVGTVFDSGKTYDIRVCRAQSRSSLVYSSKSHKIDISFLDSEILSDDSHFLLKYEGKSFHSLSTTSQEKRLISFILRLYNFDVLLLLVLESSIL